MVLIYEGVEKALEEEGTSFLVRFGSDIFLFFLSHIGKVLNSWPQNSRKFIIPTSIQWEKSIKKAQGKSGGKRGGEGAALWSVSCITKSKNPGSHKNKK